MKTVFHLSTDDPEKISELLGNIKNLNEDKSIDVERITAVLNAEGVKTALKSSEAKNYLKPMIQEGLDLKICSNSVEGREISRDDLIQGTELVSSGVGELNRLQDEGFNYIKI